MKKIYLLFMVCVLYMNVGAQTLNVPAGWPNANWTVTGSYATAAIAFESDPRTTANFAFDDDDAGSGNKDIIAAESPVIDLTAAQAAGENFLEVTAMYGFRRNLTESVKLEYWNATTSAWTAWGNVTPNYALTIIQNDFCTIPKTLYISDRLNITSFTTAQLTGFKYRIIFDDNPAGPAAWGWGFCFDAPTIKSYASFTVANCDAGLTAPQNGATDVALDGIFTWTAATGAVSGYKIALSTSPNSTSPQIYDAGNVLTYNVPGLLSGATTYYFKIIPYNLAGDATGCTEYSFTTRSIPVGATCNAPIVIDALPYTTTDDTANYLDLIDGSPGATGCGTTAAYLNGNDVVYAYTATQSASIKILMTPTATWSGIFIYENCADIGVNCVAGASGTNSAVRSIPEFLVESGQTYYIVISTNASPQTTAYTLEITENVCTNPTATYTVVSNCANGEDEFFVDTNISNMGSASSLAVYDDQGGTVQVALETGVYRSGPFPNGTEVIITVENEQSAECVLTSPIRTQTACPPVNNDPVGAVELFLDLGTACGTNAITGISNASTTGSNVATPSCGNYTPTNSNGDLWFKFEAPATEVRLNVTAVTGMTTVSGVVYSGTIGSFIEVAGSCSNGWPKTLTGLTQGETYYIRAWDYANDQIGTFTLCGYYIDCVPPTATYTVVSDCANGNDQFFVDVDVTSVGSATTLSISDNQQNSANVSTTGIVQMGPYNNGTSVIFTIVNDDNSVCTITSTARTQTACPPINDNCAGATELTPGSSLVCDNPVSGTTVGATQSLAGCLGTADDDVWYKFVATGTAHSIIIANATGSGTSDIVTQVFDSCGGASLVCQDTPNSPINLSNLTVGNTYFFRIYSYSSTLRTSFTVCIGTPPPPPANDLIANASTLTESPVSTCTNAVTGTTVSATHSAEYACSATDIDVWYIFTPSTTGIYNFSRTVVSGTGNGYISVYSGIPASLTRLNASCTSTSFSQALTAGTQYYVSVSSTAASTLTFALCVSPAPPAPANDLIANATVLTESTDLNCSNSVAGTTVSATHSVEYVCNATDVDVWYTFTPATTGSYVFRRTVSSGTGNGYISVYSGTPSSLTRLNTSCFVNNFTQALTAGTQYYVSVSSTASSTLSFGLCVYPLPAVPANDTCSTAIATTLPYTQTLDATTATNVGGFVTTCTGTSGMNDGVWYTVVGDGANITIALTNVIGWDPELAVYTGSCGSFTCVGSVDSGGASAGETYTINNSVVGTTYFINVGHYSGTIDSPEGPFTITISTTLSNPTFDSAAFKAYPNPVQDVLSLSYSQDMTNVSVFNLLGQQVINKELNASEAKVDMSNLSAGTYLVKVAVDNQVKTIKVVKQ